MVAATLERGVPLPSFLNRYPLLRSLDLDQRASPRVRKKRTGRARVVAPRQRFARRLNGRTRTTKRHRYDGTASERPYQLWDPTTQNPLQDLDGSNALVTDYVMGNGMDQTLARVAGGATHAFVNDHLDSVRGLADPAGALVNQYTYEAFGSGRSQVEAVANRLRFTARELDGATGLQFNRNRHYMPSIGRWTQRDPIGFKGGPNQYAYVNNMPTIWSDPTGEIPVDSPGGYPKPPPVRYDWWMGYPNNPWMGWYSWCRHQATLRFKMCYMIYCAYQIGPCGERVRSPFCGDCKRIYDAEIAFCGDYPAPPPDWGY